MRMNVREVYESVGYELDDVKSRLTDNEEFIARILKKFSEDGNCSRLEKALASEDYTDAYEAAHAIKGMTSNMGLSRQYDLAFKITEKLKSSDYEGLDSLCAELKRENDRVLDAVSRLD